MTPEEIRQVLIAAEHDLDQTTGCLRVVSNVLTDVRHAVEQQAKQPAQAGTDLHLAVKALFKESEDWSKSCSSTSNWFDHSPAAQALKALLKQRGTTAQEPRLTLGQVPAGGPGTYVVYLHEWTPMVYRWRDEKWHHGTHDPHEKIKGRSFADDIRATFGPVPPVPEVSKALIAAGRPT